jgi:hypothetical protein
MRVAHECHCNVIGSLDIHRLNIGKKRLMPVILDSSNYDQWLDPGMANLEAACDLLRPYDAPLMRSYPVSTRINTVANDDAECLVPTQNVETQAQLF